MKEVLDWYQEEDTRDPNRSELGEIVECMACLSALEGEIWKRNQDVVTAERLENLEVQPQERDG